MPDYKKDVSKFFPWEDEEGRKRKPERGDSIPPNTSIKSKVHSKPKVAGQEYLDMYIMTKLKERGEKYGATLGKQQKRVSGDWVKTKKEIVQGEKDLPKIFVPKGGIEESEKQAGPKTRKEIKTPGHMKKMDWTY